MDNEMDVRNQKVDDVLETVITIILDEDGETENSRIGGEERNSDMKGNRSKGNEDLKKGDDFSSVIDVKCDGKLGEDLEGDCQRVCRICHLSTYEADEKNLVDLIELDCGCKGELGFVHSHCAETWFKLKGNRVCEICGEVAQNVTGVAITDLLKNGLMRDLRQVVLVQPRRVEVVGMGSHSVTS